jgi:hypothetical protein
MYRGGERLDQSSLGIAHGVRHKMEPANRSAECLGHRTGDLASHDNQVLTQIVPTGNAITAGPANKVGLKYHTRPLVEANYLGANLVDSPDDLVPRYIWELYEWVVTSKPVQVGATNPD